MGYGILATVKVTQSDSEWNPKLYAPLLGLSTALYMITGTIAPKIIDLHGLIIPAGLLTFPLCAILTDILTEVYGFNRARQAIWVTLACTILFSFFVFIASLLPSASFWQHHEAFKEIYSITPRLALGGCLAWLVGELINSYVVSKMKIIQNAKYMGLRFIVSTFFGQFADTVIIAIIGFAGTMPLNSLVNLIITSWLLKVCYEILALPLTIYCTNKIKRFENVEHFDRQAISIL